jgi:NADPH:quinone reductase-like Zn-dependent oxidoreductase
MHAAVIEEAGGPEVLRYEEVPRPEPDDGEVLIRVHAASVNPVDWKRRRSAAGRTRPRRVRHGRGLARGGLRRG